MVDIRQTPEYGNYLSKIGWIVERIDGVNYFIKKFPFGETPLFIGSVIKIQRPEVIDNETIEQLSDKYRAFQIIIEPQKKYQVSGIKYQDFKLSKNPYLPTKTLHLDLSLSINRLISSMEKDSCAAIRKTKCLKIDEFRNGRGIEEFRNSWKSTVGWKRYIPPLSHLVTLKKSFKNDCMFLVAYSNDSNRRSIVGGAIFLIGDATAYYWQAFTNKEGRKNSSQYKIVWEGIKWAKKHGAKVFDFEGIYDERFPNKSWLGFTHFKKSFGGTEVEYPGCVTKFVVPFKL